MGIALQCKAMLIPESRVSSRKCEFGPNWRVGDEMVFV